MEHIDFVRPPLGVRPKFAWQIDRLEEIEEAIDRFMAAGYPIPLEWMDERNELVKILKEVRTT